MLTLIDGPCKAILNCRRAPLYLRAVIDRDGNIDALDQINDKPADDERVHVYQLQGDVTTAHLNFGGGRGRFEQFGTYLHRPDVDGEALRDNARWQEWAQAQVSSGPQAVTVLCPIDESPCDKTLKACCSCPRNKTPEVT